MTQVLQLLQGKLLHKNWRDLAQRLPFTLNWLKCCKWSLLHRHQGLILVLKWCGWDCKIILLSLNQRLRCCCLRRRDLSGGHCSRLHMVQGRYWWQLWPTRLLSVALALHANILSLNLTVHCNLWHPISNLTSHICDSLIQICWGLTSKQLL